MCVGGGGGGVGVHLHKGHGATVLLPTKQHMQQLRTYIRWPAVKVALKAGALTHAQSGVEHPPVSHQLFQGGPGPHHLQVAVSHTSVQAAWTEQQVMWSTSTRAPKSRLSGLLCPNMDMDSRNLRNHPEVIHRLDCPVQKSQYKLLVLC